jgi:hypothetical protein
MMAAGSRPLGRIRERPLCGDLPPAALAQDDRVNTGLRGTAALIVADGQKSQRQTMLVVGFERAL